MASLAQLHAELIGFLRQHCPVRDQRHLVLLAWMVAGLLLSETVCFNRWNTRLPLALNSSQPKTPEQRPRVMDQSRIVQWLVVVEAAGVGTWGRTFQV